ncbi:MAG: hypothetical protein SCH66_05655 [Methanolobus sp.]|nr:hypothetical protein [Methanolobus sp.]
MVRTKLGENIKQGHLIVNNLRRYAYSESSYKNHQVDLIKFRVTAENILRVRFGVNSYFYNEFVDIQEKRLRYDRDFDYYARFMLKQVGVLEAVLDALEFGLTDDLFYQRELLVFSNMLDQAYEFHEKGLFLAAGIYGRVVLETTIKEFAKEKTVDTDQKFDQIIIALRQENIINQPFEISLRANYKIGSFAAHGNEEFNDLSDKEILEYLNFIRDKVLTLK